MRDYTEFTRKQLIAMLEESNDIIDAICHFLGTNVVSELYMTHRSEEE
jgi:hypothetical protein